MNSRKLMLLGVVLLLIVSNGASGTGGSLFGGKGKYPSPAKKPLTKSKKGKPGASVVDVDTPKLRSSTAAEKRAAAAKKPPGTVSASPELEARHGQTPAGFDAGKARSLAQGIAAHLAAKGPRAYDRNRLAVWQTLAAVRADGVYGGSSRGALVFYGVQDPPRPFVAPFATLPYHPPE